MDTLNRLYGVHSKIKQIFLALGGAGVFCMMLYITVDVIVRNVANKALVGTFEVVSYYLMPLTILAGARSPCTMAGARISCTYGFLRRLIFIISCIAAPVEAVTIPTVRTNLGMGFLYSAANIPISSRRLFVSSKR